MKEKSKIQKALFRLTDLTDKGKTRAAAFSIEKETDTKYERAMNDAKAPPRGDDVDEGFRKIAERIRNIQSRRKSIRTATWMLSALIATVLALAFRGYFDTSDLSEAMPPNGIIDMTQVRLTSNLTVENATLEELLAHIESQYNIKFVVRDKHFLAYKFTGTFSRRTTIEDLLQTLGRSGNFTSVVVAPLAFELKAIDPEGK